MTSTPKVSEDDPVVQLTARDFKGKADQTGVPGVATLGSLIVFSGPAQSSA